MNESICRLIKAINVSCFPTAVWGIHFASSDGGVVHGHIYIARAYASNIATFSGVEPSMRAEFYWFWDF